MAVSAEHLGQNWQHFTGNAFVSMRVKNFRMERNSKQTNKKKDWRASDLHISNTCRLFVASHTYMPGYTRDFVVHKL